MRFEKIIIGFLFSFLVGFPVISMAACAGKTVATSYSHTCAVTSGGGVKCWGMNYYGQIGDGTSYMSSGVWDRWTPTNVSGLSSGVAAVTVGEYHSCALTTSGGVKCWGSGYQLGTGSATDHYTPVDVSGLTSGVTQIASGWHHTCALTSSGGVKCWGYNGEYDPWTGDFCGGILGDGMFNSSCQLTGTLTDVALTPISVVGLSSGVAKIAAGQFQTCALTTEGGVKCWGAPYLGNGTTSYSSTPVDLPGLSSGVLDIAVGSYQACALLSTGAVRCWGSQYLGGLGNGVLGGASYQTTPVAVTGLSSGVVDISADNSRGCAVLSTGGVKCWGVAKTGDGSTVDRSTPVSVSGISNGVQVENGGHHICVVTSAGGVKCWGQNTWPGYAGSHGGQLGDGTNVDRLTPVDVSGLTSGVATSVTGSCGAPAVVNGSCSATAGSCTTGTAASDNGLTSCGTTRTWSCNGSGGGSNASCSYTNPACAVNGSCGASSGTCSSGSVTADNGLTTCGTTRTWTCAGSGGGSNASCSYTNSACAVNGACGSSNGASFVSAPSTNLCVSGSSSAVSGSGPWTWTCNGSSGGSNASCSALKVAPVACSAPKMIHGVCGTSNGQAFYTAPSSNLCSTGTPSAVATDAGPPIGWNWTCAGSSGGSTASCSAVKKIDGVCGTAQGKASATAPTTNLCSVGSSTGFTVGASAYTWSCSGTSGGLSATCSAPRTINGACGAADGFATTVAPSANLCAAGTASAVSGAGPWAWNCSGSNGGLTKACAAPVTVAPTFGGACPS